MHTYAIAPDRSLAAIRFAGSVRGRELVATTKALHQDERWHEGMDLIWDCRRVTHLDVQPPEMAEVVRLRTDDVSGRDVSVVSREIDVLIARLYQMMARVKGKKVYVCHTLGEAAERLKLDGDALADLGL